MRSLLPIPQQADAICHLLKLETQLQSLRIPRLLIHFTGLNSLPRNPDSMVVSTTCTSPEFKGTAEGWTILGPLPANFQLKEAKIPSNLTITSTISTSAAGRKTVAVRPPTAAIPSAQLITHLQSPNLTVKKRCCSNALWSQVYINVFAEASVGNSSSVKKQSAATTLYASVVVDNGRKYRRILSLELFKRMLFPLQVRSPECSLSSKIRQWLRRKMRAIGIRKRKR
ncbi:hypothetical protein CPSG_03406 [Coccidioides posadasii str. Silveira]|uniref:Uncharacterized protein n=1 Tax=Coccidioides posadasii (strain RMSCC 757 / Silveira) TaxID=443226 RepID=E9CZX8_COCPS|nr:hypothetical protein CPSG_03406 [Coccidioides posadasii str. Silveira]